MMQATHDTKPNALASATRMSAYLRPNLAAKRLKKTPLFMLAPNSIGDWWMLNKPSARLGCRNLVKTWPSTTMTLAERILLRPKCATNSTTQNRTPSLNIIRDFIQRRVNLIEMLASLFDISKCCNRFRKYGAFATHVVRGLTVSRRLVIQPIHFQVQPILIHCSDPNPAKPEPKAE